MSGLKTGVENDIFWSETGSGFAEPSNTTPEEFPGVLPPPTPHVVCYILSVLSSCMATGRISLNNGSILVVHCLIGRLLSAALYDCIICFLLVRLLQFYVLYNIIFQSGLSMMEHFRV